MQVNITEGGKKIQLLYVLWVLENFSDRDNTLKQDDIVAILEEKGYYTERKSVARDLKLLLDFGYKIHGIEPELDEDGNELPMKRGAIWLEREITDEKLSWLMNSIKYNAFMDESQKKEFIESLISLGSKTFKEKNNSSTIIDGGRIFHVEGASLFKQLSEIDKAIALGKKIRFTYSKLKRNGSKFVYEAEKEYTVSPYWVIVNKGNTYLVCYNHEENKIWHSRVDKMKDVKMINSYALPKTETELKGVDVGDYVTKHPLMFSGDNISVELKIDKNQIGRLVEAFGTNFSIIKETEDYLMVKVYAGELDMFYWAIQYGGYVEVLKPQSLREKIRIHIESLAFNYKAREGDQYSIAIRNAIRDKVLDLSGIDLSGRKEHFGLRHVEKVYLSNNNIDNADFLKEYYGLHELYLENNPITDVNVLANLHGLREVTLRNLKLKNIDFVAEKRFTNLIIDLDRETDLSALSKIKNSKGLEITKNCYLNPTIPWDEMEKNGIQVKKDWEDEKVEENLNKFLRYKFPLNFLFDMLGSWHIEPTMFDKVKIATNKVFGKFDKKEQKYLDLRYKQEKTFDVVIKELSISKKEGENLFAAIKERVESTDICDELKKYFVANALNGKILNSQKISNMFDLTKALEKREKESK